MELEKRFFHMEHRPWTLKSEFWRFTVDTDQSRVLRIEKSIAKNLWVCTSKQPTLRVLIGGRLRAETLADCVKQTKIYRRVTKKHWAIEIDTDHATEEEMVDFYALVSRFKKSKMYSGPAPRNSAEFWDQYEWFTWRYYAMPIMVWTPHGLHAGDAPYGLDWELLESAETWAHYRQLLKDKYGTDRRRDSRENRYDLYRRKHKVKPYRYKGFIFQIGKAPIDGYDCFHKRLPPKRISRKLQRQL